MDAIAEIGMSAKDADRAVAMARKRGGDVKMVSPASEFRSSVIHLASKRHHLLYRWVSR